VPTRQIDIESYADYKQDSRIPVVGNLERDMQRPGKSKYASSPISWDQTTEMARVLAQQIRSARVSVEMVVAVARGGWIPARLLAEALGIRDMASIGIKYAEPERHTLSAYSIPSLLPSVNTILLVDDVLESGRSVRWAAEHFVDLGKRVVTAALLVTDDSRLSPDFCFQRVSSVPVMPWDRMGEL